MTPQTQASAPATSAWVAASAGTGKTRVLIERVLRLLLAGAAANHILCITFTRAAAAEIAERIHQRLGAWAICSEAELVKALGDALGRAPDRADLETARGLFTRVLDTPEGVRIKTIHGFCESLLARFPLEARIAPHFTVMDERTTAELVHTARDEVLARTRPRAGSPPPGGGLADAVAAITVHAGDDAFAELLIALVGARGRLAGMLQRFGGRAGLAVEMRRRLGLGDDDDEHAILAGACEAGAFDALGLATAAAAMQEGSATDRRHGALIADWIAQPETRAASFERYLSAFFTKEGDLRKTLIHQEALAAAPGAEGILAHEAERLVTVLERRDAARVLRITTALVTVAGALIEAYSGAKARHALLDYDDLILTTRALLRQPDVAPWVLYKLDGGLDHILIDEAQDTSPEQWEVIAALADEFFAGRGARDETRTIFAVGDTKQSIFSFQGADPVAFARWRDHFARRVAEAEQDWRLIPLELSHRSTPPILRAVDRVFAHEEARDGLLFDGGEVHHVPSRAEQAGLVELWPVLAREVEPAPEPWEVPIRVLARPTPSAELAHEIARRIASWCRDGETLESRGRPVRPGDIMILVQRRSGFVDDMIRALKAEHVPVAGLDRMVLGEQLAVMDLMAIGRFALLPEDDLNLAVVLKSPLIGCDEDALFTLAYDRKGETLWRTLAARAADTPLFAAAYTELADVLARADVVPPYEFYADLLGARGGRQRLLARLGAQANDPIDEFLALALAYERDHVATLEGFLHWLAARRTEIKRDLERARDEVQVMTVHGAKGLEAPIVFLPDTCRVPRQDSGLLWLEGEAGETLFWSPRRGRDDPVSREVRAQARRRREQEYRRLLYVALTRAEDRLYVYGWQGGPALDEGCWYNLIRRGLGETAERATIDGRSVLRLVTPQGGPPDQPAAVPVPPPPGAALPAWALHPAPTETRPPRPLAPSRPEDEEPALRSPVAGEGARPFLRGQLIHRLLQTLPDLAAEDRGAAAGRVLASPSYGLDTEAQREIAAETLAVLADPDLALLFGPGSRAEVPLAGRIGERAIAGQVDRLVVTGDKVLVVDFKSNREVPAREADVPPLYLRQMAAYRAALSKIYPDKSISCALVWTDGPHTMPLSEAVLDRMAP